MCLPCILHKAYKSHKIFFPPQLIVMEVFLLILKHAAFNFQDTILLEIRWLDIVYLNSMLSPESVLFNQDMSNNWCVWSAVELQQQTADGRMTVAVCGH